MKTVNPAITRIGPFRLALLVLPLLLYAFSFVASIFAPELFAATRLQVLIFAVATTVFILLAERIRKDVDPLIRNRRRAVGLVGFCFCTGIVVGVLSFISDIQNLGLFGTANIDPLVMLLFTGAAEIQFSESNRKPRER